MILTILLYLVAFIALVDAARTRARLAAIPLAGPASFDSDVSPAHDYALLSAPGVTFAPGALTAAAKTAAARGLAVVDLVPSRASSWRLFWLGGQLDPRRDAAGFLPMVSGGFGLLVARELIARTGRAWPAPRSAADVVIAAERLSPYARGKTGRLRVAAVSASAIASDDDAARLGLVARRFGDASGLVLLLQAALWALVIAGPFFRLVPGLVALGATLVGPLVAFAGAPVHAPRGEIARHLLLRPLLELVALAGIAAAWRPEAEPAEITARRADYAAELPLAPEGLLEPRRATCPLCGSSELASLLDSPDLVQHKPGRFNLDECRACAHVFQNPRLTLAGLSFYYRDAYDGLGADLAETLFSLATQPYEARLRSVEGLAASPPATWLDVGGGHGHFAAVARERAPGLRVDGLDFSESIEDAERRGWIDKAHRGLFVELAPALAAAGERYDVVSMSHYLEHTLSPADEIAAAHRVLPDGGLFMIEVPDPECRLGHWLGQWWFPWLQPQHLHFVSVENLERLLTAHGFEVVRVHRGEAHLSGDLFVAVYLAVGRIAPSPRAPWRPPPDLGDFVWRSAVLVAAIPFLLGAKLLDGLAAPLLRRPGWSNTYRVVARKRGA